jgi:glycosyltransferase involved in cell wall biosynthesis
MVEPGGSPPSITVFFPCYNEQDNVAKVTQQALAVLEGLHADYEVILVDDGSADATGRIAEQLAADHDRVRVIHHPQNRGYGAALQSGFRAATKELVFFTDGDGQFDLAELLPWLPLMEEYDIVCGYRLNRQDNFVRRMNGWLWTKMTGLIFSLHLRDIDCAFKLFRRSVLAGLKMESTGALISTEILARATRRGCRITQRGVHHYPRTAGKQTGCNPKVILRAFRELWQLRRRILSEP